MQNDDIDVLARTIYGEARSEGWQGMKAVACVVLNRVKRGKYGNGISGVCLKPYQFSCWLKSDPNRKIIMSVTEENKRFAECLEVATLAANGELEDITMGATHYHTTAIRPRWAPRLEYLCTIGHHKFYRED